jgi:hypothetical protein
MSPESMGDPDEWGHDPLSAELDSQVAAMPDRPEIVLAIISFDISADQANREALAPFPIQLYREIHLDCFNVKLTVTIFGFDAKDSDAFMRVISTLRRLRITEAVIYQDGLPVWRLAKLKLRAPESKEFRFP